MEATVRLGNTANECCLPADPGIEINHAKSSTVGMVACKVVFSYRNAQRMLILSSCHIAARVTLGGSELKPPAFF
jgi:hypothetical protein